VAVVAVLPYRAAMVATEDSLLAAAVVAEQLKLEIPLAQAAMAAQGWQS
jgi:hypothetical protein